MQRIKVMTQERLEKLLCSLPMLDEQCAGKDAIRCKKLGWFCAEPVQSCDHKAVIRCPNTGLLLCAAHAREHAASHPFFKECMELAVRERRFFIEHPCAECSTCDNPPHRQCSYCKAPLCYECMVFIPSKGCACSQCNAWLEADAREAEEADEEEYEEFYG